MLEQRVRLDDQMYTDDTQCTDTQYTDDTWYTDGDNYVTLTNKTRPGRFGAQIVEITSSAQ